MHSKNDLFAVLVSSNQFELVDPVTGLVVATLGPSPPAVFLNGDALIMNHNDPATTDSYLAWTQPNSYGAGIEGVMLQGPEKVGALGVGAILMLSVGNVVAAPKRAEIIGANEILFNVVDPVTNANTVKLNLIDATRHMDVQNDVMPVTSIAGKARGNLYPVQFVNGNLAAGFTVPAGGPFNILNVNLPEIAAAGALIDVDFSAYCTQLLGGNVTTLTLALNGVAVGPRAIFGYGPQGQVSNGITAVAIPAGVGNIVSLFVSELGVANSTRVQPGDTVVRVRIYH